VTPRSSLQCFIEIAAFSSLNAVENFGESFSASGAPTPPHGLDRHALRPQARPRSRSRPIFRDLSNVTICRGDSSITNGMSMR